jgi:pyrimidine deaminase RibD-like protein
LKETKISWHKESQCLFGDEVLPFIRTSIWARKDEQENMRMAGDEVEVSTKIADYTIEGDILSNNFFRKIEAYRESHRRHFMIKAIEMMYEQKRQTKELYEKLLQVEPALKMKQEDFPIIGAVLVDKNKQIVASAFKGCDCDDFDSLIKHHCEYLLFNHVLKNKEKASGSTLYCTLEPCNKRGSIPKLPCAVHCLESGIDEIFIGLLDPNPSVYKRGLKILSEGIFWVEDDLNKEYSHFLEERLGSYPKCFLVESGVKKTGYIIREGGIKVNMFHGDLVAEILRTNLKFYLSV